MKSTIATTAAATLLAFFTVGQFTKKALYTEITIDAPKEAVWQQITDTKSHAIWNPFFTRLEGSIAVGNQLSVSIQPPGGSAMNFTPRILVADQDNELRWVGHLGFRGVFDGEHYFILEESANGTTLLRHGEIFSGVLVPILFGILEENTRNGFEAMNAALKQEVERKT